MPSGQDFVNRLRDETRRILAKHVHSFEEELRTLQIDVSSSVARIVRRLGTLHEIEIPAVDKIISDAVSAAVREAERRRAEEMLFLAHFAHDMRHKETQEEILNLLLDGAHRHAPRVALFIARGNQFLGWATRGFPKLRVETPDEWALPLSASPLLRDALEADGLTTVNDLSHEGDLALWLPGSMEGPWHAFPMNALRRPVAVLLASPGDGRNCDLESLCILMDITGSCIENMALKVLHELQITRVPAKEVAPCAEAEPAAVPPAAAETAIVSTAPEACPSTEVEAIPAGQPPETTQKAAPVPEPAVEFPAADSQAHAGAPVPIAPPVPSYEMPEASTVSETEAAPAPVPEQPVVAMPEASAAEQPESAATPAPMEEVRVSEPEAQEPARTAVLREVQPLTEEERLHADAKRFARLLASEIKLYNEQRVQEGRANRDVYVRLKRDIDRSREMYEKRVSPIVSRKVDYFHDEIIRILGDNDPSTLGSDYPGSRAES